MIHHSIYYKLLRATFFLLSTIDTCTPAGSVFCVDFHAWLAQILIDILIINRTHLNDVNTINSLSLYIENSRTLLAIIVRDILATVSLPGERLQRARQNLVLVARDHEIVRIGCTYIDSAC